MQWKNVKFNLEAYWTRTSRRMATPHHMIIVAWVARNWWCCSNFERLLWKCVVGLGENQKSCLPVDLCVLLHGKVKNSWRSKEKFCDLQLKVKLISIQSYASPMHGTMLSKAVQNWADLQLCDCACIYIGAWDLSSLRESRCVFGKVQSWSWI